MKKHVAIFIPWFLLSLIGWTVAMEHYFPVEEAKAEPVTVILPGLEVGTKVEYLQVYGSTAHFSASKAMGVLTVVERRGHWIGFKRTGEVNRIKWVREERIGYYEIEVAADD